MSGENRNDNTDANTPHTLGGLEETVRVLTHIEDQRLGIDIDRHRRSTLPYLGSAVAVVAIALSTFLGTRLVELSSRASENKSGVIVDGSGGVAVSSLIDLGSLVVGEASYQSMYDPSSNSVRIFDPLSTSGQWSDEQKKAFQPACEEVKAKLGLAVKLAGFGDTVGDTLGSGYAGAERKGGDVKLC
jgi:hypothetical protein